MARPPNEPYYMERTNVRQNEKSDPLPSPLPEELRYQIIGSKIGATHNGFFAFTQLCRKLSKHRVPPMEELGRKTKVFVVADACHSFPCCPWMRRTVERRVDLNGGEVRGDIGQFVESTRGGLWVVVPPCRPDSNHAPPSLDAVAIPAPASGVRSIPFGPFPGTPFLHNPPLKSSSGDAIHPPGGHDLEHRRERGLRQSDSPLLLRFHHVQMGGVKRAVRLTSTLCQRPSRPSRSRCTSASRSSV